MRTSRNRLSALHFSCEFVVAVICFCAATAIALPAQIFTTLHYFAGQPGDGKDPYAGLVQGTDGNFYGTTYAGGASDLGAVFKMTSGGTVTILYSFTNDGDGGCKPTAGLVQGTDGNFYGTTSSCGSGSGGTVFKITSNGTLTALHDFAPSGEDGGQPYAGLIQATDGNFYGTTTAGGTQQGGGTVFKITPNGTETVLYSFTCSEGCTPYGGLVQGSDGNFYGTTRNGGTNGNNNGVVFKLTGDGGFTLLHTFVGTDGGQPYASLIQATDGNFYGTNSVGGARDGGTVFKITPNGVLTPLYSFAGLDGSTPMAPLVQAGNGNFYSTTYAGGANNVGTVFEIAPDGGQNTLHSFVGSDGAAPYAGLVLASDGAFYGTTSTGGASGDGTAFKLQLTNYTLTVSTSGDGVVTSTDGFINCPGTCTHNYPQGTQVTLNATPASGWAFSGWSGGGCSGTGPCNLTINQNLAVTGTFTQNPVNYTLTVSTTGNGSVTSTDGFINCPGTCSHTYVSLTQVTLNAAPASGWTFSGWTGACIGIGPCNVTMTQNQAVTGVFIQPGPGEGFQFVPATPCRLVDTRQSQPIQGGTSESFTLPGLGGCNIPTSAIAYSLNVTVVPQGPLGYLTIWPTGEAQPLVSTLNSPDGRVKANAAIVPAGTSGAVSVYVTNTTDVILDIDGYFQAASSLQFYPLMPCRVVDTRQTNFPQGLGAPSFGNMESRQLPVYSNSPCLDTLTITPSAYSFNVTVVPSPAGQPLNYLTIWPSDQQQPFVSTLNNPTATVVANAAIVPAAANGDVSVFTYNSTDVIIDVNGYFAPPGTGGYSFYPAAPCRVLDTRGVGNGQPFSGTLSPPVDVPASPCGSPQAQGYVFNATVVPSPTLGYLTLWPDTEMQPTVSTLNAYDGFVTSNMAIVPDVNGNIDAYAQGTTQLILDISGYFAP